MRILHFKNSPIGVEQIVSCGRGMNTSGAWVAVLLGELLQRTEHEFALLSFGNTKQVEVARGDRITCFTVPQDRGLSRHGLEACREIVTQWKPDLLHFHGTERAYGLLTATRMVRCPAVVSIQGLLGPYSEWYHYFGNRSLLDVLHMHRWLEIAGLRGPLWGYRDLKKSARRERQIIRGNGFFLGRTLWDKAWVLAENPAAVYYHGGELLRPAFWHKTWNLPQVQRHRVIFTNAGQPRKGAEVLLEAARLLKDQVPDLQVCMAGTISRRSGFGRYLRRRMQEFGTTVVELGPLSADQMADELLRSHVFVSPSFIENSPNAVCEAQLMGMPVLSTYTGGVPSLIEEGRTGLFFPTGDAPVLAALLRQLFADDTLAQRLGTQAREVARKRHDPETVVREIVSCYEDVVRATASPARVESLSCNGVA